MKSSLLTGSFATILIAAGFSLLVDSAVAQLRPLRGSGRNSQTMRGGNLKGGMEGEGRVKIERFPAPGKASMIKTPEFNARANGLQSAVNSKRREWAVFEVKYSTSKRWTDELTFTYHLLSKGKDEKGMTSFSYYTAAVRYQDIPQGDHMSCVVLPPSQVERYGSPVALALEVSGKDGVLTSAFKNSGISLGKEWWKNSKVLDDPKVKRRTGLVDRSKSPFYLINLDDDEVVQ